jgi:hypothetical protein
MRGIKLVVSDDHAGLKAARSATLHGILWTRCELRTIRNAGAHVPKASIRADVIQDLKRVFNADDAAEADRRLKEMVARYQKPAPGLADWLEANVPEALTVLGFPPGSPPEAPHIEWTRTTEQEDQTPHPSRHAVPQRDITAQACLCGPQRDQRRLGDRTVLPEYGGLLTRPIIQAYTEEQLLHLIACRSAIGRPIIKGNLLRPCRICWIIAFG